MTPNLIQGFTVLPLCFSSDSLNPHDLFMKEHSVRNYDASKPPGKTLFVINIPSYATEAGLKNVFAAAGKVKVVTLQTSVDDKSSCGFKMGYVVFEKREGLINALKLDVLNALSTDEAPVLTGVKKWAKEYNASVCDQELLKRQINDFMTNYDKLEEERKMDEKQVDDEGWTVVTKKGRNPGLSRKESVANKLNLKYKIRSRKKELKNFYTFQLKEQKMKSIIALRKNFQDSKEKVNLMKKMRNFKPY